MKILRRIRSLFTRRKLDAEMTEEMRLHVELQTERNIRDGINPDEARYLALRQFGNVTGLQEQAREVRGWLWLEHWLRDFRFSFRSLRRSPGFCITIIITLALCIAANTSLLATLYSLILKPLPFRDQDKLVEVYNSQLKAGEPKKLTSVAQYLDFKANADLFEGFALWGAWPFTVGEEFDPVRSTGAQTTADLFSLLDIQPLYGRFFTMDECTPGKDHVIVLTQSFWETYYAADPSVIGRVVRFSGEKFTIIGVAPRAFEAFKSDATVLKPIKWEARMAASASRQIYYLKLYARIKTGVTEFDALSQLTAIEQNFFDRGATPELRDLMERSGQRIALGQVRAEQTRAIRTSLFMLQGGALFVLLLGCVNVTSLMLIRANARQGEFAVRQALGAGRGALMRQMISEGVLLSSIGAIAGVSCAWICLRVINRFTTTIAHEVQLATLDGVVLGITLLAAFTVAFFTALLPAFKIRGSGFSVHHGTRSASTAKSIRVKSGLLVSVQVALALVLMVGACLLIRSFAHVLAVEPGFDARHIVHARIALNASYADRAGAQAVQNRIVENFSQIPGVESVSYSFVAPVTGDFSEFVLPIRGSIVGKTETYPKGNYLGVSPDFFRTMGIRIIEGRGFEASDLLPKSVRVFVVDRKFAELYFPGRSAVGERFASGDKPENDPVIVGVAEVAKFKGQEETGGSPFVYSAISARGGEFSLEVRTTRPFPDVVREMRNRLHAIDPALPLFKVSTLQENLEAALLNRRGVMGLLGAFAGIALTLSAVGIYGTLAYDVAQRSQEIGIRCAIGATPKQIITLILKQGLSQTALGLLVGLVMAGYLSHAFSHLLFEVKPADPVSFAGALFMMISVSGLAGWLPARRAARVDPVVALRAE